MAKFRRINLRAGIHVGFYGGEKVTLTDRDPFETDNKALIKKLSEDDALEAVEEVPEEPTVPEGDKEPEGDGDKK
ncbi:MAG: hypothetical protein HGB37_01535 [Candidatus Moranbacteria bacterium]|nr:hypothetical protein [Candidatus Moranbacteria bacterium]